MNTQIELHIEELVVHGVQPHDARAIGLAVERELSLLLTRHGMPQGLTRDRRLGVLDGGVIKSNGGREIAGAVFNGMRNAKIK
ncbi:hypothetical protein [Puia dinghuensis]|uniref:Uncharacterized protein n=1 Tax=Puia dinghuensis TaxID=1792502 RepID=A0A8J2UA03_9BACT|nr:hypothetical protein [Puia dinghuensis]GGA88684.1 hypothetical protein GCM10011511_09890 [Puia dinghuensis]